MLNQPVLLARIAILAPLILSVLFYILGIQNGIFQFILQFAPSAVLLYCFKQFSLAYNNPKLFIYERNSFIILVINLLFPSVVGLFLPPIPAEALQDPRILQEYMVAMFTNPIVIATTIFGFVLWIAAFYFFRYAHLELSRSSGVQGFDSGSLTVLIGIPLIFLFGVGVIVMFLGGIVLLVAYFELTDAQVATAREEHIRQAHFENDEDSIFQ
ncbi:MAG: DUF996 domain-containing protein [Bacteroidetes bacterium]|nr:MAG: DUF996 domain-containing protein [Bacteroidota bacterium]